MQKSKLPSLISILILTLVTVAMWVGFSIYRAFVQSPTPVVPAAISAALTPSLDTSTIGNVEGRLFLNDSQIPEVNVSATSTPAPAASPINIPTASPSATPVATSSATPTATP